MATEEIRNRGNNYSRANTLPCIQAAAKGGLLWLHFHHWLNMPFWAVILKYLFPATTATPAPCQPGTHLALPSSDPQELCNWDFHIIRAREYRRRRNILTKTSLKRAGAMSTFHIPSTLPRYLQFAVRASRKMKVPAWSWKENMLESTFCLMSGENKARGCCYPAT